MLVVSVLIFILLVSVVEYTYLLLSSFFAAY